MTFVTITSRLAHLSRSVSCQRVTACASLVLVPGTRTVITLRGMKLCGVPSRGDEQLGAQLNLPQFHGSYAGSVNDQAGACLPGYTTSLSHPGKGIYRLACLSKSLLCHHSFRA